MSLNSRHAGPSARGSAPRLLYVVTEDWAFLSHRLPMARAARDAGFEVHVATRIGAGAAAIAREQFILHPTPFARGSLSPLAALRTIAALRRIHRAINPDIVHHVALQACVLGMIAALGRPCGSVNAFIGLGYSFTSNTAKARVLRRLIGAVLRLLVDRPSSIALMQNGDDVAALLSLGIAKNRIVLIPGSGVDVRRFTPLAEPQGPPTFGFVGRLLDDKGIRMLIAAHRLLRERGMDARLLIAGAPDPANPASVSQAEAASWNDEPGITCLGHVDDIAGLWARAHVAVLPSRREGLPLSLMEAAACGRAMLASDVPGCREVVIHEQPACWFRSMTRGLWLMRWSDLPARLNCARNLVGRRGYLAVERFAADIIGRQTIELYRRLLVERPVQASKPL